MDNRIEGFSFTMSSILMSTEIIRIANNPIVNAMAPPQLGVNPKCSTVIGAVNPAVTPPEKRRSTARKKDNFCSKVRDTSPPITPATVAESFIPSCSSQFIY